ncbi:TonB-dependent receptor [Puia dinghuensis]|uniref:TonB-dependent receptor n=2 Tax=Puia dinghuensis TaxID=1792502 RepID=A0A8J2UHE1_9BACT|nr:TonB-dependent receptor [Puia dinghuensis]
MIKRTLLSFVAICLAFISQAGTIKGKIRDSKTGEPMTGATVTLANTRYWTTVQLDGTFTFRHVPAGKYQLTASAVGYQRSTPVEVVLSSDNDEKDLALSLSVSTTTLEEVQISAASGGSDNTARRIEQRSDMVQNILSARTIEISPDITVANALQRVSGVVIQRDNTGDGRYAIIRGMDQRYNNTLVNGIKIPSPDDKYRFVPMNIFPAEMLERLEVIKALTPNMEGDAIGGTMNLVMKNAPDKFIFSANGSLGYSTIFNDNPFVAFPHAGINKQSPAEIHGNDYGAAVSDFTTNNLKFYNRATPINNTLGFTIGDRFLDKKLGIILSASYQDLYKGAVSERLVPDAQPLPSPDPNTLNPSDSYVRTYSTRTNRIGLQNKIDYLFNDRNRISLFNLYLHQDQFETRYTPDSSSAGLNSTATQTLVKPEYRSRWQIQDIYNATLQGNHQLSNKVRVDWSGVYSIAKQQIPDMASYTWDQVVYREASGKTDSIRNTIPQGTSNAVTHRWQHNKDQDWAGYGNVEYKPSLFQREFAFQLGGLYRYKTRDSYNNDYALQAVNGGAPYSGLDGEELYFQATGQNKGSYTAINAQSYTAHEKVAAGYIMTRFLLVPKFQVLGGVRVENTQDDYTTVLPKTSTIGASGTIHYTDVLPSVHLKYSLQSNQNLRLSYFKSISRPGFGDLVPITDNSNEEFTFLGNPYLKHVRADNLDLRYELFPGLADQFLVGAFYKHLTNPIEYYVTNVNGPSSLYLRPQNTNEATNYGAEIVFTKYWGVFGISANYTYTHSEVTTTKRLYGLVSGSIQTQNINQSRPLQGQADHVGNFSLLLKDPRWGLDAQLALAYTGTRIVQVSPYYGLDIWGKPIAQLDLSVEKRLYRRLVFFAKINNLTNSPNKEYIKFPYTKVNANLPSGYTIPFQDGGSNYTVAQKDIYKISYLGGLRYKF